MKSKDWEGFVKVAHALRWDAELKAEVEQIDASIFGSLTKTYLAGATRYSIRLVRSDGSRSISVESYHPAECLAQAMEAMAKNS
jgi:hypothetical protein